MSSDRRCRGCCRVACGPEEEQIDEFLKNQIRAAGVQATALLKFRAQNICRPFYFCIENLVLWTRSEFFGSALEFCV